jgi:hypothetical protein
MQIGKAHLFMGMVTAVTGWERPEAAYECVGGNAFIAGKYRSTPSFE